MYYHLFEDVENRSIFKPLFIVLIGRSCLSQCSVRLFYIRHSMPARKVSIYRIAFFQCILFRTNDLKKICFQMIWAICFPVLRFDRPPFENCQNCEQKRTGVFVAPFIVVTTCIILVLQLVLVLFICILKRKDVHAFMKGNKKSTSKWLKNTTSHLHIHVAEMLV